MGSIASGIGSVVGGLSGGIAQGAGATDNFTGTNPLSTVNQNTLSQAIQQSQGNLANTQTGQQQLAQALLAQSQGQGANPAQAMLNQQTNQNIAQNQGMIASQKGINPALVQRQAAENAGAMNQQAAGQGATLDAQQQIAAQQNLGGLYNQMAQQNLSNTATSGGLLNQAGLGAQGITASAQAQNAQTQGQIAGGLLGGLGSVGAGALGGSGKADGGMITVPKDHMDKIMALAAKGGGVPGKAEVAGDSPTNDTVPTMLSPGEVVIPRSKANDPEKAKEFVKHIKKQKGGDDDGYGKIIQAHRKLGELLKQRSA